MTNCFSAGLQKLTRNGPYPLKRLRSQSHHANNPPSTLAGPVRPMRQHSAQPADEADGKRSRSGHAGAYEVAAGPLSPWKAEKAFGDVPGSQILNLIEAQR